MRGPQIAATRFIMGTSTEVAHGQTDHALTLLAESRDSVRNGGKERRSIGSVTSRFRKSNRFRRLKLSLTCAEFGKLFTVG